MDVMAITYSRPASTLASTSSGSNGITAHAASAGISESTGAIRNSTLFEPEGMMISFVSSFSASAIGCARPPSQRIPKKVTRFGPRRTCMKPITLRSASVR
jgi:hypothetical protein